MAAARSLRINTLLPQIVAFRRKSPIPTPTSTPTTTATGTGSDKSRLRSPSQSQPQPQPRSPRASTLPATAVAPKDLVARLQDAGKGRSSPLPVSSPPSTSPEPLARPTVHRIQLQPQHDASYPPGGAKTPVLPAADAELDEGWSLVRVGVAQLQGRRPSMEDRFTIVRDLNSTCSDLDDGHRRSYVAVFDGHCGPRAAEFAAEHLHRNIVSNASFFSSDAEQVERAITDGFIRTEEDFLKRAEARCWDDGTTALSAILVGPTLFIANLGDCRAVLSVRKKARRLSTDHRPGEPNERSRIEACEHGRRALWLPTPEAARVYCAPTSTSLAVSRAIGDRLFKRHLPGVVSAAPQITTTTIDTDADFLILACDGLWDVISDQRAVDTVWRVMQEGYTCENKIAQTLVSLAYDQWSCDNVTALVVLFNHDAQDPDEGSPGQVSPKPDLAHRAPLAT